MVQKNEQAEQQLLDMQQQKEQQQGDVKEKIDEKKDARKRKYACKNTNEE